MGCLAGISQNITNDCSKQPNKGLEQEVYIMNRTDMSFTVDGTNPLLVTSISMASGTQAYKLTGYKEDIDAGFDLVVSEKLPEQYKHYFMAEPWGESSDEIKVLDDLEDIVVIVERSGGKDKNAGDGAFQVYGLYLGLDKSSATARANNNNGVPTYEFASRDGSEEKHSRFVFYDTDYATSKAALEALLTPAP